MRKDETAAGGAKGYVDQVRLSTPRTPHTPDQDYVHPNGLVQGPWTQNVADERATPPVPDSTLKPAPSR